MPADGQRSCPVRRGPGTTGPIRDAQDSDPRHERNRGGERNASPAGCRWR